MHTTADEIIRCLLRDLETYGSAIAYAERIACERSDPRDTTLRQEYAVAAERMRTMQQVACDMADKRNRN